MDFMGQVRKNLEEVQERIEKAADRSGRRADEIRLMAVTKVKPRDMVEEAYQAGIRLFGENRVQEAEEKYRGFHGDAELHLIGHLQTNKVKKIVGLASCVQSIDKLKTAREIEKRFEEVGPLDVYLEFNTSGEESKSGYLSKERMFEDIDAMLDMENLQIRGLMTIGPLTDDDAEIRRAFSFLRELFEETKGRYPQIPLEELSMGMTSDYEAAIEEGSTMVRIGSALFGAREYA